jgi:hypothetical protein
MFATRLAVLVLLSATALTAQTIPPGTALPVMVNTGLNAKGVKPNQKIEGKLMQEVNLPDGAKLKSGAHVTGHVVSVSRPKGSGSRIVLQFDQLQDEHLSIPLHVSLRAIASSENVFQAGTPIDAASTNEGSQSWVTKQVGGDVVFRGRGYVASKQGKVGVYSGTGTWGKLSAAGDCPASEGNPQQALWIFSTTACGIYGFEHTKLDQSGLTPPLDQIAFSSPKDIDIRAGSGWLLVTNPAADSAGQK